MDQRERWNGVLGEALSLGFARDGMGWSLLAPDVIVTLCLGDFRQPSPHHEVSWSFAYQPESNVGKHAVVVLSSPIIEGIDHFSFRRRAIPKLFAGLGAPLEGRLARRFDIAGWPRVPLLGLMTPALASALTRVASCPRWQVFQSTSRIADRVAGCITINYPLATSPGPAIVGASVDVLRALDAGRSSNRAPPTTGRRPSRG